MTELLRELEAVVSRMEAIKVANWDVDTAELSATRIAVIDFVHDHHAEIAEALMDAERYRWLREQQWESAGIFVVAGSKSAVKLGAYCPSQDRLDNAIDNSIAIEANNSAREVGE